MDVEVGGDLAVERLQELLELNRAVAAVQRTDDFWVFVSPSTARPTLDAASSVTVSTITSACARE